MIVLNVRSGKQESLMSKNNSFRMNYTNAKQTGPVKIVIGDDVVKEMKSSII